MSELQELFAYEYDLTSSHKFRHPKVCSICLEHYQLFVMYTGYAILFCLLLLFDE